MCGVCVCVWCGCVCVVCVVCEVCVWCVWCVCVVCVVFGVCVCVCVCVCVVRVWCGVVLGGIRILGDGIDLRLILGYHGIRWY